MHERITALALPEPQEKSQLRSLQALIAAAELLWLALRT